MYINTDVHLCVEYYRCRVRCTVLQYYYSEGSYTVLQFFIEVYNTKDEVSYTVLEMLLQVYTTIDVKSDLQYYRY